MSELFNGARALIPVSERDSLKKAIYKIEARRTGKLKSLKSAWPKFNDAFCDGLEWRTITVIGARPGTGKTLFMEQLVDDIIKFNGDHKFRILKFQFEMLDETNGIRKLSLNTGHNYNSLMSKAEPLDDVVFNKCIELYKKSAENDIIDVIYDPCTVDVMCATIHHHIEKYCEIIIDSEGKKTKKYTNMLVTVDHSALFRVAKNEKDKFTMLYALGEALTYMKKHYPVAFVILSQLNRNIDNPERVRDGEYGNYILDSDLFGADALLQHADVVLGINKPSIRKIRQYGPERFIIEDDETLVFHFLKSRNGLTKISFFKLDRETMKIVEMPPPVQAMNITTKK